MTRLELERPHWTGNIFGLPGFYQYGVGSAGFGAWRELAAHQRTTNWVLDGSCPSFPLLHHWRIVDDTPQPGDPGRYSDADPGVRKRLETLATATASVVLVLEWIPRNLDQWLTAHPERFDWADAQVHAVIDFMAANGMVHFDVHPGNLLCDGERVYVTDFGLAADRGFDLDDREREFLDRHHDYDRRNAERYLASYATDGRYEQAARVMDSFFDQLSVGPKSEVSWPPTGV